MIDERTMERFWSKVEADDETGCWLWTAAKVHNGYGQFWDGGKVVLAHRFAWELRHGPIPEGLQIDHLCRMRACVNVDHMEPVGHRTNVLRGVSFSAVNAAKTECVNGHPFDETNTYVLPNGWRLCRTCHRRWERERYRRKVGVSAANAAKTHCPQGHPYDDANTYWYANGWRACRTCKRLRRRERYWATKKAKETRR